MKRLLPTLTPWLPRCLAVLCTAYLAMLPTNNLVWPRSFTFAMMSAALVLTVATHARQASQRFAGGGGALLAILLWWLWSSASLAWTIDPRFSVREWETELQYGAFVFTAFFFGVRHERDCRAMVTTLLVSFTLLGVTLVVTTLATGRFDPGRWHHDVGVWSTHLVEVAPLLLLLLFGFDGAQANGRRSLLFVLLLLLMLANARLTDNRIVWVAFAAAYGVAAAAALLHSRKSLAMLSWKIAAPVAALLLLFGFAFAEVAQEKAELYYPRDASVSGSLANDPRIALWKAVGKRIHEAPWLGHGFGRGILRDELPVELNNRALTHPHNTFVGQWLETGAIGLVLFLAMLATLALRYARLVRARDGELAMTGIVGLSLLAGYAVKNLTDDFFYRSNSKLFWALTAILLARSILRESALREAAAESI